MFKQNDVAFETAKKRSYVVNDELDLVVTTHANSEEEADNLARDIARFLNALNKVNTESGALPASHRD